jgi:hypothetical protein
MLDTDEREGRQLIFSLVLRSQLDHAHVLVVGCALSSEIGALSPLAQSNRGQSSVLTAQQGKAQSSGVTADDAVPRITAYPHPSLGSARNLITSSLVKSHQRVGKRGSTILLLLAGILDETLSSFESFFFVCASKSKL